MLSLAASTKIYVAAGSTDMRKGFDDLHALVANQLCTPGLIALVYSLQRRSYFWSIIRFQIILKFLSSRAGSVAVGASPKPRDFLGIAPVFNDAWLLALLSPTMLRLLGETQQALWGHNL